MAATVRRFASQAASTAPLPARLLQPTPRADLRVSWHAETDEFVLSLWHGDACVGSAPLEAKAAADVAAFLVTHLGDRSAPLPVVGPT